MDNYNISKMIGDAVKLGHEIAKVTGQSPKDVYNPIITQLPGVTPYKHDPINMGNWAKK
jgi:hypothetical protein